MVANAHEVAPAVLIVEDDAALQYALGRHLESEGFNVCREGSVAGAIVRLTEKTFEVAVVDLGLGDGDGISLIQEVRRRSPTTEILIITGRPSQDSAISALRSGAFDYLLKPVVSAHLVERIREALARRSSRLEVVLRTERKLAAQARALEKAVADLNRAQEIARIGFWIAPKRDSDESDWWSSEIYRLLGIEPHLPASRETYLARMHPEDRPRYLRAVQEAATVGRVDFEHRIVRPNGEVRWVRVQADSEVEPETGEARLVGTTKDVTERRRAQTDFDRFFDISRDLFAIANTAGRFVRVNPAFTASLGFTEEELTSRPYMDFVHPDDVAATTAEVRKLETGEATMRFQNRYRHQDGSYRVVSWVSVPDLDARVVYAVGRDVTEKQTLEDRLALTERMAAIGSLAAGLAHEINNPLAFVMSNLRFALDQLSPAASSTELPGPSLWTDVKEALSEAHQGAERVRTIVHDLKSFSRPADTDEVTHDLHRLLDGAVSMAANEIRHRATLIKQYGEVTSVNGAPSRLGQVFLNLIVNAAQAIPDGAAQDNRITLTTGCDPDGRVRVEISDTGTGIPPHVLSRIFEPFFTTKPVGVGTGLGLSICHGIVSGMGGELLVRSTVGAGSTFVVMLSPTPERRVLQIPAHAPAPQRRARVLFIDDEPLVGNALRRELGEFHDVVCVSEAAEAFSLLERDSRFDVIFCDVMMPHFGGADFFDVLQRHSPSLAKRVVFVTGGAFSEAAQQFLSSTTNRTLNKPFDRKELLKAIEAAA